VIGADAAGYQPELLESGTGVQVVLVNYRTPRLTIDCLSALADEVAAMPGVRVAVVDNASEDGSVERLQATTRSSAQRWNQPSRRATSGC
jgi:N-acetylglucosaminyl-diphospho-decaprenol L-rhamnosyltransferase